MLSVSNLSVQFGKRVLFDEVNTAFNNGNCYGIIGANGSGKSTFLKIISGKLEPTSGHVSLESGKRMSVLEQNHNLYDAHTVLETILMGNKPLYKIKTEIDALYADYSDENAEKIGELQVKFEEMDGWNADSNAASMLSNLGIKEEFHHTLMADLDGKQKVRVLLAQALFGNPDVLIMDEPTNDLDYETISWLENFLANYDNCVIVVSHDRHFLDAVCTHISDIDFGRKKMIEKLNIGDIRRTSRRYPAIIFEREREAGDQILNIEGLAASTEGEILFKNIDLNLAKGDKVVVFSRDSRATTAFYQILNNKEKADAGKFMWGVTTTQSYLPLDNSEFFNNELTLIDWLRQWATTEEEREEVNIRGFLGKMIFSGEEAFKKSSVLSGGEKVRCMLSRMMMMRANVIQLDEPTNHLDLESITAFNNSLKNFKGTILFTTHDHEFAQTVANRVVELTPSGVIDRYTTFDEYMQDKKIKALRDKMYGVNA